MNIPTAGRDTATTRRDTATAGRDTATTRRDTATTRRDTATTRRRPAVVGFVVVAALACLALGWWQWSRFESGSGSFQNLGYALQWPLFAVFVVYAYRRFVRLEDQEGATDQPAGFGAPPPTELAEGVLPPRRPAPAPHDEEDDPTLRDYNAYLAELDERDPGGARAGKTSS